MGAYKPYKIKLSNGMASGMYLLANPDEIKYDKYGNTKSLQGRAYKIQIEIEVVYNNQRKRGKKSFSIPRGTSMVKAVQSLQGKKSEMISLLKTKGTLKTDKVVIHSIPKDEKNFYSCWLSYYETKLVANEIKESTYKIYKSTFDVYLKPLYKKKLKDITIEDVQNIVNNALTNNMSASTVSKIKPAIKPLLAQYDVTLNWSKLIVPKIDNVRKYKKTKSETNKIIKALLEYKNPQIRAIFNFSLTGRRISEILALKYENINWEKNTYTIPKEDVKTGKAMEFRLTPQLINAIKSRGDIKKSGKIFSYSCPKYISKCFKRCMNDLGIYDLHLHDIRSLVAQTALDNGASIYDVSALLGHSNLLTTEKRYVDRNKDHAKKALDKFLLATADVIKNNESIIDVEVIEDKFEKIKNIYPNATDEQIKQAMSILEGNKLLKETK